MHPPFMKLHDSRPKSTHPAGKVGLASSGEDLEGFALGSFVLNILVPDPSSKWILKCEYVSSRRDGSRKVTVSGTEGTHMNL